MGWLSSFSLLFVILLASIPLAPGANDCLNSTIAGGDSSACNATTVLDSIFSSYSANDTNATNESIMPTEPFAATSETNGTFTQNETVLANDTNSTILPAEPNAVDNQTNNETALQNDTSPANGTIQPAEPNATDNQTNIANGTILPSMPDNQTITIETNQTTNGAGNQTANFENETIPPAAAPAANYEIISTSDSATAIRSPAGNTIEIDSDAFSKLQNNETVRIIAKSSRRIGLSGFNSSAQLTLLKKSPLPSKIAVFETGNTAIPQLADLGFENIYIDSQMSASLSDTVPLIGAGRAQSELNYTGEGITVCLLDTGVDFSNPSLGGKAAGGYDFVNSDTDATDDNGHGTDMALVIHTAAPNATILSVKVLGSNATGYASDVLSGIDYCTQLSSGGSVKIISMSFGDEEFTSYCINDPVADAANAAVASGLLVVASTGNIGSDFITNPACAQNVTAVSASTKTDAIWNSSNMNGMVDLLAPGENVIINGQPASGTSISAAHVSGAAALLLQSNSSLSPSEAEYRFKTTGRLIEFNGANYTRIDVYNAITNNITGEPTSQPINQTNETGNYTYTASTACTNTLSVCGVLDAANCAYNLSASVSNLTANCFNVTAANVTLNCKGLSITGGNVTSTAGVYSTQLNTTVKNCNISNFDSGIQFAGATFGTISDNNISGTSTNGRGVYFSSSFTSSNSVSGNRMNTTLNAISVATSNSQYNTFTNNTAISQTSSAVISLGTSNTFTNVTATTSSDLATSGAFYLNGLSGSIINSTAVSTGAAPAILLGSSSSSTAITKTAATAATGNALQISSANTNSISNSTFTSTSGTVASLATSNSNFTNNTFTSGDASQPLVVLTGSSAGNTFYWNNFTATTGKYVNDSSSGTNYYNGSTEGNIWADVQNRSVLVYGTSASAGFPSLYVGTTNYNNSTSGKILGNVADSHPLTPSLGCVALSAANASYSLAANVSTGATCFNVTAANVTLNCNGYTITGNNTSNTYGVYSNQFNTTIKNCVISNFSTSIYYSSANNGTISNVNASTTSGSGYNVYLLSSSNASISNLNSTATTNVSIYLSSSSFNTLTNITSTATSSTGIYLSSSNSNTLDNATSTSATADGIYALSSSNNSFSNSRGTSNGARYGIIISGGSNNNFTNFTGQSSIQAGIILTGTNGNILSNVTATSTGQALLLQASAYGNIVKNSNITATSNGNGVFMYVAAYGNTIANSTITSVTNTAINLVNTTSNTFYNNTVSATSGALVSLAAPSGNNTFYWNNFTTTSGQYVNDANGSNYYNTSAEGNIWFDVQNRSVQVTGNSTSSGFPSLYIGTNGTGYPYNNSTSSKIVGNVVDSHPLTPNLPESCGLNMASSITLTANRSVSGANCYNVTAANVTINCNGFSITGNNTSGTYGIYSNQFNTTIKNCSISSFETAIRISQATNATISDVNATTYFVTRVVALDGANYSSIQRMRVLANLTPYSGSIWGALPYVGIYLNASFYNTITDSSVFGGDSDGCVYFSSSSNNSIARFNCTTQTDVEGIYLSSSSNNTLNALSIGPLQNGAPLALAAGSNQNTIANSTLNGSNPGDPAHGTINLLSSSNNVLYNNTILTNPTGGDDLLDIDSTSSNNTFYWNNFTNTTTFGAYTSGLYVNDTNGSNHYNSSTEGNIWFDVLNGSVKVYGVSYSSGFPSIYIGSTGSGYPYGNSTSSKITGNVVDYHPLTSYPNTAPAISAIAVSPPSPNKSTNISCNITVADAEQTSLNITYEWYKNGTNQTALAGTFSNLANNTATLVSNLTSGNFSKGQNWSCRARAFDGGNYSSWNMSANVTIANARPAVSSSNLSSSLFPSVTLYAGDTMLGNCTGTDSDGDTVKYWWAFYKNGTVFSSGNTSSYYAQGTSVNVANITGSSLKSANWTLECKADDSFLNSTAQNSTQLNLASCFNLSIAGQSYALAENAAISGATCYDVRAANVTLNCNGYSITGGSTGYGISSNQTNTTIKNCIISGFDSGIYLSAASNANVTNTSISNSSGNGMVASSTANSSFSNLTIASSQSDTGIYCYSSTFNNFSSIRITGNNLAFWTEDGSCDSNIFTNIYASNSQGFTLGTSNNNQFSNATIAATSGTALSFNGNNNSIVGSNLTSEGSGNGIGISSGSNNSITNSTGASNTGIGIYVAGGSGNNITNSNGSTVEIGYGIQVSSTANFTLDRTRATASDNPALYLSGCSNGNIFNSSGNASQGGMSISSSTYMSILDSNGTSSEAQGISISTGGNNTITNAIGTSVFDSGISISSSSNNNITNSSGTTDSGSGIYLSTSTSNTISNSNGTTNSGYGIRLFSSSNSNNLTTVIGNATGSGTGISLSGSSWNRIINSNASTGSGMSVSLETSSNNSLSNVRGIGGNALYLLSSSNNNITDSFLNASGNNIGISLNGSDNYNIISNSTGISGSSIGISISGNYNTVANSTANSSSSYAVYAAGTGNIITNSTGSSDSNAGIYLESSSNSTIANSTFSSNTSNALSLSSSSNSSIYNNTFISSSAASTLVLLLGTSANNKFYWNNFTNTSGAYVNDSSSGTNHLNTSVNGVAQGNYYYNVHTTNEVKVYDGNLDGWADSAPQPGYAYPYNSSNSLGKIIGSAADWGPAVIPYRITYTTTAYFNGTQAIYFANGTTANITSSSTFTSTPSILIIDSSGTTRANTTMSGSSPYYYEYTLNGSDGWYNTTISENNISFSFPVLFYGAQQWKTNFTDASGKIFTYRAALNITEPNVVARDRQPVEAYFSMPSEGGNNSVRLTLLQNNSLIEIPVQLSNTSINSSSGKLNGTSIFFIDTFTKNQTKNYYAYYSFANRTATNYASDLSITNNSGNFSFSNVNFLLNTTESKGGTITGLQSKWSGMEFAATSSPQAGPETVLVDYLASRAYNATSPATSLSQNGSVFSKYNATGSYLLLNYQLTYTFYSGTPYFILETNFTIPVSGVPMAYRDTNLSLAKGRFNTLTYFNGSATATQALASSGAGSTYASLTNISQLSFTQSNLKNALGVLLVNDTSSASFAPLATVADTANDYQFSRLVFNGTANSTTWFYSKNAYMIYDPAGSANANSTYLALANPVTSSFGSEENISAPPPTYTVANYTPLAANDTGNVTCYSYWASSMVELLSAAITFNSSNFSATTSQDLSGNESWVNYTVNSTVLQAGAASCNITVTDSFGGTNSTLISFSVGDLKAPIFTKINSTPSSEAELDPGVTVIIDANLTEFSNVSSAILQYNSTVNSTLANVTMGLASSGTHWYYYRANFTPAVEGNYTYRIFASDNYSNSNYSNFTTLIVFYDWTWTRSPSSFTAVGVSTGTNATIGSLTINVTGDNAMAFTIRSNFHDANKIYYNNTAEGLSGYTISIPAGTAKTLALVGTGRSNPSTDQVTVTITSQNTSASPSAYNTTFTFVSCGSGPCLALTIGTYPSSVTQGNTGINLNGTVTNVGTGANSTSTGTVLTWTLPTGWTITSGSASKSVGTLLSGESATHPIVTSISATAPTGAKSLNLDASNSENSTTSASVQVIVIASSSNNSTPIPTPTPSPSGGGGGGGGAPGGNMTAAKPITKVVKPLSLAQKSQLFSTLASYELVRGRDSTFTLNITNPLAQDLENISIGVSGYLYQYLNLQPSHIDSIPAGGSKEVQITIVAPKYFNQGTFTLYFNISGTSTEETEDSIITTNIRETRTVELKILEMSREDAFKLLTEANSIRQQMTDAGVYHGTIVGIFDDINASYSADKFGDLKPQVAKMRDLEQAAFTAQERLDILKQKLDSAQSEDLKTPQTMRLYSLASSAFERGDYANAMLRISDAELTYALETAQSFSPYAFVKKYSTQIMMGLIMLCIVSLIIYVDLRFWTMDSELSQLSNEEGIVLGLIKEMQTEYFGRGKMSTEEYYTSVEQYDARLGKIVQRKVELETIKENYFSMHGKGGRLIAEKKRLEQLIAQLQSAYLEQGKMETRVYENRMKSYVSRLSEIEESMAVAEAQMSIKKSQGILDIFKRQPPEDAAIAEEPADIAKKPGLLDMFKKKPPKDDAA